MTWLHAFTLGIVVLIGGGFLLALCWFCVLFFLYICDTHPNWGLLLMFLIGLTAIIIEFHSCGVN